MEKVIKNLNDIGINYGDSIIIGVSGGPDSMALIDIVKNFYKNKEVQIVCAHINHNMRKESEYERDYVEEYCLINKIVFEYHKIENYGDDNFHNEARNIRYKYFNGLIKKYNAKYLFTAHHGDDLIETILMRIVRGSTLKGYSGFSKIIEKENYKIVRPLINSTKDDIYEYLKSEKIKYMTDASNEKDVYTRNRFRKYIVKPLKKEEKNIHDKFYKFSSNLLECNEFIDKIVSEKMDLVYPQKTLNIEEFLKQEKIIQNKIITNIFENIYQDDLILINDQHIELFHGAVNSKRASLKLHLPNNYNLLKSYNNIIITSDLESSDEYEIEIIDFVNLPNGKNIEKIDMCTQNSNYICRLNSNEIELPLYVRNKKDGDKINIKGMLGSKKVSDIFINEKISIKQRENWPIVVDSSNKIVWLPGLKKSKYDKQNDENYDIILRYY